MRRTEKTIFKHTIRGFLCNFPQKELRWIEFLKRRYFIIKIAFEIDLKIQKLFGLMPVKHDNTPSRSEYCKPA